ncbi:MAG: hypothetical protein AAGI54_00980 [Planctomycetota bacterium]
MNRGTLALLTLVMALMHHPGAHASETVQAAPESDAAAERPAHGMVGLRPLARNEQDYNANHGGSWMGVPTYAEQQGNYPFVAEHVDVVKGWLAGDFKTKRMFMEHYWGLGGNRDSDVPAENLLIQSIAKWEKHGGEVVHILLCREYDLAINRGHHDAKPGPFNEDTRILYEEDIDEIRRLFKQAHTEGILKHDNYGIIMMVQEPTFYMDPRVRPIIEKVEGICLEVHQFNRHWPLETGWVQPEKVIAGANYTLEMGKEFVFYYGPVEYNSERYEPFLEREWLETYWEKGLPKHHPRMHYYLNIFPHRGARQRPVGPETDPHSNLGFTKWVIEEIKSIDAEGYDEAGSS